MRSRFHSAVRNAAATDVPAPARRSASTAQAAAKAVGAVSTGTAATTTSSPSSRQSASSSVRSCQRRPVAAARAERLLAVPTRCCRTSAQPFSPVVATPLTRNRWKATKNRPIGSSDSTDMANMAP